MKPPRFFRAAATHSRSPLFNYIDGLLPNKIIIGDLAPIDLLALAKNYFYFFFGFKVKERTSFVYTD
jgi:hypothetical protein